MRTRFNREADLEDRSVSIHYPGLTAAYGSYRPTYFGAGHGEFARSHGPLENRGGAPIADGSASSVTGSADNTPQVLAAATPAATHLTIVANYDSSITALQTSNPTLYTAYTGAITTAINFYENLITNPITVTIDFGWGEVAGSTVTAAGQSNYSLYGESYASVANALKATDTTSTVQTTAAATLPATDPTGGSTFYVATAEAKAIGLAANGTSLDGSVGINSSLTWAFTQSSIPASSYDATGVLEHEISEVMGREAFGGGAQFGAGTVSYSPLDLFRYTAAGNSATAALGSPAGVRDEPFVSGYSAINQSYFSYDGKTVTLPFSSPADVTNGNDIADWITTLKGDSFGDAYQGTVGAVSTTDQQVLNVLGYDLSAACYRTGTLIATPQGEVPIESLNIGDAVLTVGDAARSIRWIGRRSYTGAHAAGNRHVLPIRIRAGAWTDAAGAALPRRDLWVSPEHAMYLGGLLIPAHALVNGISIVQDLNVDEVSYVHLELESHDVIFAEGAPSESFVDDDSRDRFDNAAEYVALYPDAIAKPARFCAPRSEEGYELEAVRGQINERAGVRRAA